MGKFKIKLSIIKNKKQIGEGLLFRKVLSFGSLTIKDQIKHGEEEL